MKINAVILLLFFALISNNYGRGQHGFSVQIDVSGFDRGVTVEEITGSGFIITGYTTHETTGEDVLLIKTNSQGDTLWTRSYGGPGLDNGWAVRQTEDGGFIIVGFTDSFGAGGMDVYLIRTDSVGEEIWTKTFGGQEDEHGWDVRITKEGGFIIAAETGSYGNGELDAYLIKTDSNGNVEWTNSYGGAQIDRIFSVQQTADNGYVTAGISYSFTSVDANDRDGYLLKTNASGAMEWYTTIGGDAYDVAHSVALTNDGGYIVTGYGESFGTNGSLDVYLIKTDAFGNPLWTKVHGTSMDERGIKGQQTSDSGYIAIGFTEENADMYLLRADSLGNLLWSQTFGSRYKVDFGYTVQETNDGGFVLTGHTNTFSGTEGDVLLIKTDKNGRISILSDLEYDYPGTTLLDQNYPNPFSVETTIDYHLNEKSHIELNVYTISGQKVATLINQKQYAGNHSVKFFASGLPCGVYLCKLIATNGQQQIKKLVLTR